MNTYLIPSDEGKVTIFIGDNKEAISNTTTHYFHMPYIDITIDTLFIRTIDTYEKEISVIAYTGEEQVAEDNLFYLGRFLFPMLTKQIEIGNLIVPELIIPYSPVNEIALLNIWVDKPGLASEIHIKIGR